MADDPTPPPPPSVVVAPQPGSSAAVIVPATNGNGRLSRLDYILGSIMFVCIAGSIGLTGVGAKYQPQNGNWQLLSDTIKALFSFAEKIMIGYFALALPKVANGNGGK